MTTYNVTVTSNTGVHDGPSVEYKTYQTVSDQMNFSKVLSYQLGILIAETLNIHPAVVFHFKPGAVPVDTLRFGITTSLKMVYKSTSAETMHFQDVVAQLFVEALSQGFSFHVVSKAVYGLQILSKLLFHDNPKAAAKYAPALMDTILAHASLARFLGGFLTNNFSFHASDTPLWQFPRALSSNVSLHAVLAGASLLVRFDLTDEFDLGDTANVLKAIYDGQLSDAIEITAGYLAPNGSFTTWAINTRTSAITEYENFIFNSYASMGSHFYGANSEGLWQLDGELDNGQAIPTVLRGGYLQLGGTHFTAFKAVYLGLRCRSNQNDFYFKLIAGDGRVYIYKVRPNSSSGIWNVNNPNNEMVPGSTDATNASLMTTKINLGKGLRSRYFKWELDTVGGEDYDLESIEFIPLISKRRV